MNGSISPEQAAALPWDQPAPPIVVDDSPGGSVGAAHGRTLPLIGERRLYPVDVSFEDGRKRVYAETTDEAVAAIVGGDLPEVTADGRAAEVAGDEQSVEDAAVAAFRLRAAHAAGVRRQLQQAINTDAQSSGAWNALTTEEQSVLAGAASDEGGIPVGVRAVGWAPGGPMDADGNPVQGEFGLWECSVPLVLSTGDYEPFTQIDPPVSELTTTIGGIENMVVPRERNLKWLRVTSDDPIMPDSQAYLDSLHDAGAVQVTYRAYEQPDALWA